MYSFNPWKLSSARRIELLRHAYIIMRAYRLAGMPQPGLPAVGSFDAWSRRVRDLVYWLKGYDISEAFRRNKAEDPQRAGRWLASGSTSRSLWYEVVQKRGSQAGVSAGSRRATPHTGLPSPTPTEQKLADAVEDVFGSRGINAKLFGYWARRVQGSHIDGFILDAQRDPATNANVATVRRSP